MPILITGAAGFIGFHLVNELINRGHSVIGIDNLNDYYDPALKLNRLEAISNNKNAAQFEFLKEDIANRRGIEKIFEKYEFNIVINLAAQAGVRYSLEKPHKYIDSNLVGFMNILEGCRHKKIRHLIYASSSSVYGMNLQQPFSVNDRVDNPISLYAATKRSNELMAYSYSHLFNIPSTGLRFFTVYGPYGRPDMAYYKFTKAIISGSPIDIYNNGNMKRDFTYIDDIVYGIIKIIDKVPDSQKSSISASSPPHKIYNIGNNSPVTLHEFITAIENACGKKAVKNLLPMQPGDVPITFADIDDLIKDVGFKPSTSIQEGIDRFVSWYLDTQQK